MPERRAVALDPHALGGHALVGEDRQAPELVPSDQLVVDRIEQDRVRRTGHDPLCWSSAARIAARFLDSNLLTRQRTGGPEAATVRPARDGLRLGACAAPTPRRGRRLRLAGPGGLRGAGAAAAGDQQRGQRARRQHRGADRQRGGHAVDVVLRREVAAGAREDARQDGDAHHAAELADRVRRARGLAGLLRAHRAQHRVGGRGEDEPHAGAAEDEGRHQRRVRRCRPRRRSPATRPRRPAARARAPSAGARRCGPTAARRSARRTSASRSTAASAARTPAASSPATVWKNCERKKIDPKTPKNIANETAFVAENARLLKKRSGSIGSGARRSQSRNAASSASPRADQAERRARSSSPARWRGRSRARAPSGRRRRARGRAGRGARSARGSRAGRAARTGRARGRSAR